MATRKRLSRHEMKEPDQLLSVFERGFVYARQNTQQVLLAAIVAVAVTVATLGVKGWMAHRVQSANEDLSHLLEMSEEPTPTPAASGATPADTSAADDVAREASIIAQADVFLSQHRVSGPRRAANMIRGQALARSGNYAEAAQAFGEVAGERPDDVLAAAAVLARSDAQAAAGDSGTAIAELKRLASGSNPNLPKDLLLERAAAIAERSAQYEEALTLYRRLTDEARTPAAKSRAESKVEELQARVSSLSPAPGKPEAEGAAAP